MSKKPQPATPGSPWYRIADMTRLLDVSERTIWTWCSQGKLPPPVRRGPRWTRWSKDAVDAHLAGMTAAAVAAAGRRSAS